MGKDSEKGRYASPEGSARWVYLATMSCALLIFCVGCIPGWNSPTLGILMGPDTPVPLTSSDASTLSSMIALGQGTGPVLTVVMADKLGRRNSLLVTGIPMIISWGLIAFTRHYVVLFVARFIAGLSLGLILCIPPMYLGEIASVRLRGAIGMVCNTMLNAGVLFMFVLVPYLSVQTMALVSMGISILAVITIWFIPESPYFLVMIGKVDEAEDTLEKLRGITDVAEELALIKMTIGQKGKIAEGNEKEEIRETQKESNALKRLFTVPGHRRALCINMLFAVVRPFGSYIVIMIYGHIIFENMNTGVSAHLCTMTVASLQLVCNTLTVFIIDKLGRRPLICISGALSGTCLMIVAVYFHLMEYTEIDVTPYAMFALGAIFANVIAFNIGLIPLQQVIQSEIFHTDIKGLATCIIGVSGGVMGTISIKSYLMLAETWGLGHSVPFFIFVAVTWICTVFILRLLPETKGKTLFQIQKDLNA